MAEEKKTATAKPVAKAAAKKETEVKAAPAAAEVKKEAAPKKAAAPKKEAAPKKAATTKKAAAPKKEAAKATTSVYVQFSDKSYSTVELAKIAEDVWVYDLGKKAADMKSVEIYVKPEESMAYFVVNGNEFGSFMI